MKEGKINRAETNWKKSDKSLKNYQKYINGKTPDRYKLTLIDLLYISNFKGGNATIDEDAQIIELQLEPYGNLLSHINQAFPIPFLTQLSEPDLVKLKSLAQQFLSLSEKDETSIDGFKSSRLSALLHSYFPDLLPILDRRLLINLELVVESDLDSERQVKDIAIHYPDLIQKVLKVCTVLKKRIREIDQIYFMEELPIWAKQKRMKKEITIEPKTNKQ